MNDEVFGRGDIHTIDAVCHDGCGDMLQYAKKVRPEADLRADAGAAKPSKLAAKKHEPTSWPEEVQRFVTEDAFGVKVFECLADYYTEQMEEGFNEAYQVMQDLQKRLEEAKRKSDGYVWQFTARKGDRIVETRLYWDMGKAQEAITVEMAKKRSDADCFAVQMTKFHDA